MNTSTENNFSIKVSVALLVLQSGTPTHNEPEAQSRHNIHIAHLKNNLMVFFFVTADEMQLLNQSKTLKQITTGQIKTLMSMCIYSMCIVY